VDSVSHGAAFLSLVLPVLFITLDLKAKVMERMLAIGGEYNKWLFMVIGEKEPAIRG
jgi:hypothetical protein